MQSNGELDAEAIVIDSENENEDSGNEDEDSMENAVLTDCTYHQMVTLTTISNNESQKKIKVGMRNFEILQMIGHGAFASVYLTRKKHGPDADKKYAMKRVPILTAIEYTKAAINTCTERKVLELVREYPFFCKMHYAFRDATYLYFVLDYMPGGDLFEYLRFVDGFIPPELVRTWAAELVITLETLHNLKILFRDLKLENILLDAKGHTVLCDFNISTKLTGPKFTTHEVCGTYSYMAPEVIPLPPKDNGEGYSFNIDWWALGIVMYELATGEAPLNVSDSLTDQQEIAKILRMKIDYSYILDTANDFSLVQFIQGLLKADPKLRLGNKVGDIKKLQYFKAIKWDDVIENRNFVLKDFNQEIIGRHTIKTEQNGNRASNKVKRIKNKYAAFFKGFEFVSPEILEQQKPSDANNNRKRKRNKEPAPIVNRKIENGRQKNQATENNETDFPGFTTESIQSDSIQKIKVMNDITSGRASNQNNVMRVTGYRPAHEAIEHNFLFIDKEILCLRDELRLIIQKCNILPSLYDNNLFIYFLMERANDTDTYKRLPHTLFRNVIKRPRRPAANYHILNKKICIEYFQQNLSKLIAEFLEQGVANNRKRQPIRRSERIIAKKARSFRRI